MDLYYYVCPVCGFVHQVPAYWCDFSPEDTMEMEHLNLQTMDICGETSLMLKEDQQQ
ncbi:hypothetical protein [Anaerotalea alkaliphila]|uniref:Rubredoxin n=1 Tax=Anaerotalea alkaliphila TaxID=2662126 RepID=A0A7X5KNB8_9FIRM|nr:hypothetical protein [Anaerotalea alkaliphila]NDL68704.1 hypothetical protein [Anaerotalea alkaliphila]